MKTSFTTFVSMIKSSTIKMMIAGLAITMVGFTSCSNDDDETHYITTSVGSGAQKTFTGKVSFNAESNTQSYTISSANPIYIMCKASWCKACPADNRRMAGCSTTDETTIIINVTNNHQESQRSTKIVVYDAKTDQQIGTIWVKQESRYYTIPSGNDNNEREIDREIETEPHNPRFRDDDRFVDASSVGTNNL